MNLDSIPMPWLEDEPYVCGGIGAKHTNEEGKTVRQMYLKVTLSEIRKMADNPPSTDKDRARWIIPSSLPTRTFEKQREEGKFHYLWADIDKPVGPMDRLVKLVDRNILNCRNAEYYSSRSATEEVQKFRILVPLGSPLSPEEWRRCQMAMSLQLMRVGIEPDTAVHRHGQLCYLPNKGRFYRSLPRRNGVTLNPARDWPETLADMVRREEVFAQQKELEAIARKQAAEERARLKGPYQGPDIIKEFKARYTVEDMLSEAGYDRKGDDWRHPNSQSGSYSLRVSEGLAFSLSSSDPLWTGGAGGRAHDSFSCFVVLFNDGDVRKAIKAAKERMGGQ